MNILKINKKCVVDKEITANVHRKLSEDLSLFVKDNVKKITWYASLRPCETEMIPHEDESKKYEEIQILLLELKTYENIFQIAKTVMNAIPYPVLLVFAYKNKAKIVMSKIRKSKAGNREYVIESLFQTIWVYPEEPLAKDTQILSYLNVEIASEVSVYDVYNKLFNDILLHKWQGMTKAQAYRIIDYLLGKASGTKKAKILQSCDVVNFYPPANQGKNAKFQRRSSSHYCLHDYGDIWHALMNCPDTRKVLEYRKIESLEYLLYKCDEYYTQSEM